MCNLIWKTLYDTLDKPLWNLNTVYISETNLAKINYFLLWHSSFSKQFLDKRSTLVVSLKGHWHEIFSFSFFHESFPPRPLIRTLGPFRFFRENIGSSRCTTDTTDTGGKYKRSKRTVAKLLLATMITAANLPPLSMTLVVSSLCCALDGRFCSITACAFLERVLPGLVFCTAACAVSGVSGLQQPVLPLNVSVLQQAVFPERVYLTVAYILQLDEPVL